MSTVQGSVISLILTLARMVRDLGLGVQFEGFPLGFRA